MYQVPTAIWNAIAQTQQLSNPAMATLFRMDEQTMLATLAQQAKALEAAGVPDSVIVAYQEAAPLLTENEAISRYIEQTGNSSLRTALPEILTPEEAVALEANERPLSSSEQKQLLQMLRALTTSQAA